VSPDNPPLLIVGASARAAAYSAARAGFEPYWIDQYGDVDLRERFAGRCLAPGTYPGGLLEAEAVAPAAPWIYTGALENHPAVMRRLSKRRALWGNDVSVCAAVRDPVRLSACLAGARIAHPPCTLDPAAACDGQWLAKPLRGAGGFGIRRWDGAARFRRGRDYLQRHVEGDSRSAVFVGDGREAMLLGVTEQLVGLAAFHAGAFVYCGSLGPLAPDAKLEAQWRRIGTALAGCFALHGLFGVDAIERAGEVQPVEVNPRYTASVEVLERATGVAALALHRAGCEGTFARMPAPVSASFGKAYLFAPEDLIVPETDALLAGAAVGGCEIADRPPAGTRVLRRHPIMTLLVKGRSLEDCRERLMAAAAAVSGTLRVSGRSRG
jgi:predicted ATP-grasp superfamily ATP-dependent carboligase